MTMLPEDALRQALGQALRQAQKEGALPHFEVPQEVPLERPKQEALGDWATPVCMQLARLARINIMRADNRWVRRTSPH
ncbi:MAG: hypothetical protein H5T66_00490, partial [Chloroflexi bacterium]|nr:hypothetical protein [Chloroflexota bacterium]